jgi:hypothetical protein
MLSWPQTTKDFNLYKISRKANYNLIEKILLFNYDDIVKDNELIEQIYGTALFYSNDRTISLINLFVRENNIKINRYNILENIYKARIRKNEDDNNEYAKQRPYYTRMDMCSYANFNELKDLQIEYIHKYWNMFEVK